MRDQWFDVQRAISNKPETLFHVAMGSPVYKHGWIVSAMFPFRIVVTGTGSGSGSNVQIPKGSSELMVDPSPTDDHDPAHLVCVWSAFHLTD